MTDPEIELSVVIPMRDAATTINDQLDALRSQEWSGSWEVVIVDNGSSDEGPAAVRRCAATDPRVRLLDGSTQPGPAAARNVGSLAARGRHLAFCDADDVVGQGWVAAMGEALRVAPAATGPQEQTRLNPAALLDVYGRSPARCMQVFEGVFPFGPSANFGIRRGVLCELGGFDASIEVGEDVELCLRLWLAGEELRFVPEAVVHYRHRTELRPLFRQAMRYGEAGPLIVDRMRSHGVGPPSRWAGLRNWAWLLRHVGSLRSPVGRARWVVVAGRAIGRLIGSLRHRTLFL